MNPLAIALLLLTGVTPAFSQPKKTAPAPTRWPVQSIKVEGNKHYTSEQIVAASGLHIGQLAGKDEFEAARDRLVASGVFETVGYRFAPNSDSSGYTASFQVLEMEPVYPVRLDGFTVPVAEITAWLARNDPFFGPRIPATAPILKHHTAQIEKYLAEQGHPTRVTAKVVSDAPNQFTVVIRPANSEPVVAEVLFEGNTVLPSTLLLNHFSGVAYGTPYRETAFRQLLDASVRPIYEARGRVRVTFPTIKTEKAKGVEGLVVTVTVNEGEVYELGEVRIDGPTPVPARDLVKAGDFKPGDFANFDDIATGMERMRRRLRKDGYTRAQLDTSRKIDDRKKLVDLTVRVEPGPQFLFAKLIIEGLDIHGEAAIRKMWTLKEGKPFNSDYPEFFLQRVREAGVFDNLGKTRSVVDVNEQSRTVDVTLKFR